MAQFVVHRNPDPEGATWAPYLLVLQNDLLSHLGTVVVAPLVDESAFGTPARILNPVFTVEHRRVVLSTAELAGISRRSLGEEVTSLATERETIMAAWDLIFSGI